MRRALVLRIVRGLAPLQPSRVAETLLLGPSHLQES